VIDPSLLESAQNGDGGWGYRGAAPSATEPTAFAVLALSAAGAPQSPACARGVDWLKTRQRSDGGWPPRQEVAQSTWVTALPLLFPVSLRARLNAPAAVDWILEQSGRESSFVQRLRMRLLGLSIGVDDSNPGWPWYPETAAWVTPTALTILALEKVQREKPAPAVEQRCSSGRAFLLARRCVDHGWNHGSTQALGYHGASYPETTGLALLALHGASGLEESIAAAQRHLGIVKSSEGLNWLRLGLGAHRLPVPATGDFPPRTNADLALAIITEAAHTKSDIFLD
jgi:hypothetical protein